MDSRQFTGADERPHASANGEPEPWVCLDCSAAGRGYVKRAKHWYETGQGHRIVWGHDPRAKAAPKETQPIGLAHASGEK